MSGGRTKKFTLVELLVVIGVISLLMAMILPAMKSAKESGRRSSCASNLREITRANLLYHEDYGRLIAAAEDMGGANLTRWHGKRNSPSYSENFDFTRSHLYQYLGGSAQIKRCPTLGQKTDFNLPAYEKGGGGYGYNECIGSRMYFEDNPWTLASNREGLAISQIRHSSATVMFADAACIVDLVGSHAASGRIAENSFAQSPYYVFNRAEVSAWGLAWPTIHFRHLKSANLSWCDGHISTERMSFSNGTDWENDNLGWFGPQNNSLFDPF